MTKSRQIIELRQYTLYPGKRDILIDLFEREFVESQEALGMRIVGQFRDLDKPDRFVWIRAFEGMPSRAAGLSAFYGGPVWQAHREVANETMADSDMSCSYAPLATHRPSPTATCLGARRAQPERPRGSSSQTSANLDTPADADFVEFFERNVQPELATAGLPVLAYFVSESAANNFPRLPVRESEHAFVWFSTFADQAVYERRLVALASRWRSGVSAALSDRLNAPLEILRLAPTARSRLHN